ncbi:MAG TPA: hypothetical protein VJB97_04090 [Candidatus Paceibacterota bacterium]
MEYRHIDSLEVATGIARERAKHIHVENYWALLVLFTILVLTALLAKFVGAGAAVAVAALGLLGHLVALKTGLYLPAESASQTTESHRTARV